MPASVPGQAELAADLDRLYALVDRLAAVNGVRRLAECSGRSGWPARGVYFFHEEGEVRGNGRPRLVRVGTHAVSAGSKTTLWNRLSTHRGSTSGGGNHRGSIFRLHVGGALLDRDGAIQPRVETWGVGNNAPADVKDGERHVEEAVSAHIGAMPFTWVAIEDEASKHSLRADIERNSLGLLSRAIREGLEGPSASWLGHHCRHEVVRACGLWNVKCVEGEYDRSFLDRLESLVAQAEGA